jgi:hypothetical protein
MGRSRKLSHTPLVFGFDWASVAGGRRQACQPPLETGSAVGLLTGHVLPPSTCVGRRAPGARGPRRGHMCRPPMRGRADSDGPPVSVHQPLPHWEGRVQPARCSCLHPGAAVSSAGLSRRRASDRSGRDTAGPGWTHRDMIRNRAAAATGTPVSGLPADAQRRHARPGGEAVEENHDR